MKNILVFFTVFFCFGSAVAASDVVADSFGLIGWEKLSKNPTVAILAPKIRHGQSTQADLDLVNRAIGVDPRDRGLRAIRAELAISVGLDRRLAEDLRGRRADKVGAPLEDRFEYGYLQYQIARHTYPEKPGVTSDYDKGGPPFNPDSADALAEANMLHKETLPELIVFADRMIRHGESEHPRRLLRQAMKMRPDLWELKVLYLYSLRQGVMTTDFDPQKRAFVALGNPDEAKQPAQALTLSQELLKSHGDRAAVVYFAAVAAKDAKEGARARALFQRYLKQADPGDAGKVRRSTAQQLLRKTFR
jgi:hypothetical protein